VGNKYMKKCSTSLSIKKMTVKTTLRVHLTSIRTAMFKRKITNAGENVKEETRG
jgi:hypothetical protein